jgi:hypothetical protein
MWGASHPTFLKPFPGPLGPARLQKRTPKSPTRLPSGTQLLCIRPGPGIRPPDPWIAPERASFAFVLASISLLPARISTCRRIKTRLIILDCAIVLPGQKSAFRAGCRPDCCREVTEIGPPASRRPAGGRISVISRGQSGQNPGRQADFRPGSNIVSQ